MMRIFLTFGYSCFLLITSLMPFNLHASEGVKRSVVFRTYQRYNTLPEIPKVPGERARKVGIGLTAAGLGLLGVGSVLIATAGWQRVNTQAGPSFQTRNVSGAIGILVLVPGIGFTIPGAIVWGISDRKIKRYRQNLSKELVPVPIQPKGDGNDRIPPQDRY